MKTHGIFMIGALACLVGSGCASDDGKGDGGTDGGDSTGATSDDGGPSTSPMPSTDSDSDPDPDGTTGGATTGEPDVDTGEPATDSGDSTDSGDASGSSDSGGATGSPAAPTVVETTPSDGASGVSADATLVVRFSEPMDEVSVQQAYQSVDIPAGAVTFDWNDMGDEVTITPNAPLEYAEGSDPASTDALAYAFTITNIAESEMGVPLEDDVVVSFTTLRRIEQTVQRDEDMSGNVADLGGLSGSGYIGDRSNNDVVRYAVTFDLGELAPGIVELESAQFSAAWTGQTGNPWAGLGGGTVWQHVAYDTLDDSVFDAPAFGSGAGLFVNVGETSVSRDASTHLQAALDDPATFEDRLQLRVRWFLDSDGDSAYDGVALIGDSLELDVAYLAP